MTFSTTSRAARFARRRRRLRAAASGRPRQRHHAGPSGSSRARTASAAENLTSVSSQSPTRFISSATCASSCSIRVSISQNPRQPEDAGGLTAEEGPHLFAEPVLGGAGLGPGPIPPRLRSAGSSTLNATSSAACRSVLSLNEVCSHHRTSRTASGFKCRRSDSGSDTAVPSDEVLVDAARQVAALADVRDPRRGGQPPYIA